MNQTVSKIQNDLSARLNHLTIAVEPEEERGYHITVEHGGVKAYHYVPLHLADRWNERVAANVAGNLVDLMGMLYFGKKVRP